MMTEELPGNDTNLDSLLNRHFAGKVVRKDPALTAEALIAHCRLHLTGYKVPRRVEFRPELPKTNVGKILRRLLRDG